MNNLLGIMLGFNESNAEFLTLVAGQVLLKYVGRVEFHLISSTALWSTNHRSTLFAPLVRIRIRLKNPFVNANGKLQRTNNCIKTPNKFDFANCTMRISQNKINKRLLGNRWASTFILIKSASNFKNMKGNNLSILLKRNQIIK